MFKTIDECRVELVSYTVLTAPVEEITMLADGGGGKPRMMVDTALQNAQYLPCSAARASFGNEDKTGEDVGKDQKLMRYLSDHKHVTPFEYQHATLLVEAPIFILRQMDKHRTMDQIPYHLSANEMSRRYTEENIEFWLPDKWRGQSTSNKQASSDDVITQLRPRPTKDDPFGNEPGDPFKEYKALCQIAENMYYHFLASGVSREQARALLGQGLITRRFVGGNLRNWANYLYLRTEDGVQEEHKIIAHKAADILRNLWPESCKAMGI